MKEPPYFTPSGAYSPTKHVRVLKDTVIRLERDKAALARRVAELEGHLDRIAERFPMAMAGEA
ncbi:hypothetical protein dsx2_2619 [Desulfovibrio sp. X2]|uniref:hypothetical protein n=1 Tax=Desulfovibrio sp. X2 TaxID=941449 RepID=UPI000358BDBC|nr:hypothetical protein [Desulfovibrio sp. X2]EPR42702.1 hypothetical protein dsx2_2619 [Desulfovibrio sp. X2]